jgi:hypothetical protein
MRAAHGGAEDDQANGRAARADDQRHRVPPCTGREAACHRSHEPGDTAARVPQALGVSLGGSRMTPRRVL